MQGFPRRSKSRLVAENLKPAFDVSVDQTDARDASEREGRIANAISR